MVLTWCGKNILNEGDQFKATIHNPQYGLQGVEDRKGIVEYKIQVCNIILSSPNTVPEEARIKVRVHCEDYFEKISYAIECVWSLIEFPEDAAPSRIRLPGFHRAAPSVTRFYLIDGTPYRRWSDIDELRQDEPDDDLGEGVDQILKKACIQLGKRDLSKWLDTKSGNNHLYFKPASQDTKSAIIVNNADLETDPVYTFSQLEERGPDENLEVADCRRRSKV